MHVCLPCMHWCLQWPEDGIESFRDRIRSSCRPNYTGNQFRGAAVQGHPWYYSKFKTSLGKILLFVFFIFLMENSTQQSVLHRTVLREDTLVCLTAVLMFSLQIFLFSFSLMFQGKTLKMYEI